MAGAVPEDGLSLKDMVFLSGGPRDWTGFQRAEVGGEGHARLPDSRSCGLQAGLWWGWEHGRLGRGFNCTCKWENCSRPRDRWARVGGELVFQMLPAAGIPGLLLVKIFHLSCFLSFSKPFCLGLFALRHETQQPPHGK